MPVPICGKQSRNSIFVGLTSALVLSFGTASAQTSSQPYPSRQTSQQYPQQQPIQSQQNGHLGQRGRVNPYNNPTNNRAYSSPPKGEPLENMVSRRMKSKVPNGYSLRGAGFYVDWKGHFLTASHVVLGCKTFTVSDTYGAKTEAIFIGADTTKDIAILKASTVLANPLIVSDYTYRGLTELNAVASMNGRGVENVKRTSIVGLLNLGKSSVMRVVPAQDSGVSGAPLLNDSGNVSGIVVGRWGEAGAAESIATSGQDIIAFLNYHKISKVAPHTSKQGLFGSSKSAIPAWSELRRSVLSIECKGG